MATLLEEMVRHDLLPYRARDGGFAREWAEYKRALRRVEELDPGLVSGPGITPLSELDEAAVALVNAAWHAGAAVGGAFAEAEAVLHGWPERVCDHCQGAGRARGEKRDCIPCSGTGVVDANDVG